MKRSSTSFAIRELQIKQLWDTIRYLLEKLKSKKLTIPVDGQVQKRQELLLIAGENAKLYSLFGRQFSTSLQN